ncbi:MAG: hypothetical protein AB2826_19825 [Candidatus Thiodiazotropha sp.]
MIEKNNTEGAGTPGTATDETHTTSKFFDADASLEIDRLRIENEQLTGRIKALEAAAAFDYVQLAKTLSGHASDIGVFSIWLLNEWSAFRQRLDKLAPGGDDFQSAVESFDFAIDTVRSAHGQFEDFLDAKANEYSGKILSDSAEHVIQAYADLITECEARQKQYDALQSSMPFYDAAIMDLIKNRGVEINGQI